MARESSKKAGAAGEGGGRKSRDAGGAPAGDDPGKDGGGPPQAADTTGKSGGGPPPAVGAPRVVPSRILEAIPAPETLGARLDATPEFAGVRHAASICNLLIPLYLDGGSPWCGDQSVAGEIARAAGSVRAQQNADGTIDSVNLRSPPDTGFVVQATAFALRALTSVRRSRAASPSVASGHGESRAHSPAISEAADALRAFLDAARAPMLHGGIHTPNHRWVVSAALALLHAEFGDPSLAERMDAWLAEGIDIDGDGQFAERSPAIYSRVSVECLLEIALVTGRRELLEPVRRCLDAIRYLVHPDDRVETVASRRQDQFRTDYTISPYYFAYRALAMLDDDPTLAAVAGQIEERRPAELIHSAVRLFAFPEVAAAGRGLDGGSGAHGSDAGLAGGTPEGGEPGAGRSIPGGRHAGAFPTSYRRFFAGASLLRRRSGPVSISVFGGSDNQPTAAIDGMVSGRATSPTIVSFANGAAACRWVRIAPFFFGVGYLRPSIVSRDGDRIVLEDTREVGYVQPLEATDRSADGSYPLTTSDERYWAAASLDRRGISEVQRLRCRITVELDDSSCEVNVSAECSGETPLWFEIACAPAGERTRILEAGERVRVAGGEEHIRTGAAGGVESHAGGQEHIRTGAAGGFRSGAAGAVEIAFEPERPTRWIPESRVLGDVDSLRLQRELHEHGEAGLPEALPTDRRGPTREAVYPARHADSRLQLMLAPFVAPGSARLILRAFDGY